ncbi:MAG: HAD-IIB family hydrolase [Methylohalobius sp. ZOD2]
MKQRNGLYIVLISVHGLIRGKDLELGRDADTGGQVLYVVELARHLAEHPDVAQVDLLTRRVQDAKVSSDYARSEESLSDKARIVRVTCGPRRYLYKETLWPYLDTFVDHALLHIRSVGRVPDVIHAHYADAGYAGARLASLLGVPLVYTGHSLGRVKRERLQARGLKPKTVEDRYNISQRIEAEEFALDTAAFVVASTRQEVDEQYALYDNYQPRDMGVIPPGVDLSRFQPPRRGESWPSIFDELSRFLKRPRKPMILALARADERKNHTGLIRAYGENPELQEAANLVLVAGNREDIKTLERGPREVLTQILLAVDRYDLYGKCAYPKHHQSEDVPDLYRIAARTRGVFVNPALTEPFGLTLVEAAASGLPIVATEDGGPRDIVRHCRNGMLVDPLDTEALGRTLLEALAQKDRWRRWARSGLRGVHRHYSWQAHVEKYLRQLHRVIGRRQRARLAPTPSRLPTVERLVISDIDNTLIGGSREAVDTLMSRLRTNSVRPGFGIATGRRVEAAVKVLKEWGVPRPDVLISAVGSEIHYGHLGRRLLEEEAWKRHIDYRWRPKALHEAMINLPGLTLQPRSEQRAHKISYYVEPDKAPSVAEIKRHLRRLDLHANVIYSHQAFLDVLPIRASKGLAIRFLAWRWGLPLERILVAGDSGNDAEMLVGDTLGVVVGNYSPELERLRGKPRIYFAEATYAGGILEGLDYYRFLGSMDLPEETEDY